MDSKQKVFNLIGLATKAGKTKSGEFSTEQSVKKGRACLVVVAEDASDNTKKMFQDMCGYYHVKISIFGSKAELGRAMGKEMRASLSVEDAGLASAIGKQMAAAGQQRMTINGGSEV
ncbi:MAG: ribosomal L7Ae/L30e/S12e/Gadd45 family protein [Lachnospiraceae bacterium]|nr:ribosomal L7Ae/L30e/S12e/Gadd45 family protein [Lachnospiraceae bacterium]